MSGGSTLLKHFARYVAAKISLYLPNEHTITITNSNFTRHRKAPYRDLLMTVRISYLINMTEFIMKPSYGFATS